MESQDEGYSVQERGGQPLLWFEDLDDATRAELRAAGHGIDTTCEPHARPPSPVVRQPAARRTPAQPPSQGPSGS